MRRPAGSSPELRGRPVCLTAPVRLPSTPWPVDGGDGTPAYPADERPRPAAQRPRRAPERPAHRHDRLRHRPLRRSRCARPAPRGAAPDGPSTWHGPPPVGPAAAQRPASPAARGRSAAASHPQRRPAAASHRLRGRAPAARARPQAWSTGAHAAEAGPAWLGSGPRRAGGGAHRAARLRQGRRARGGRRRGRARRVPRATPPSGGRIARRTSRRDLPRAGGGRPQEPGWQATPIDVLEGTADPRRRRAAAHVPHPDVHREGLRDPVGVDGDHAARLHRLPERPGARRQDDLSVLRPAAGRRRRLPRPGRLDQRVHRRSSPPTSSCAHCRASVR